MLKHLLGFCVLLALLAATTAVKAAINPEQFLPENGYVAGTPLTANFFDALKDGNGDTISSAGVLDIEDVGGTHGLAVKFTANGPDPGPSFPKVQAQAGDASGGGWGGPPRQFNNPADGDSRLWWTVDVQKGVGDANTPLSSFIWALSFTRPNGQNIFTLDGGLGTFRLKTQNATVNVGAFTLGQGWNQIAVMNDLGANPNTVLYLNGIQIATIQALTGALQSGTTNTGSVNLTQLSRGGTGDNFVGTMRFDNIITANENIIKFLDGDVNHDGIVDVSDIQLIAANYLTTGPAGDANGDGFVDVSDIQTIAANYLNGGGGALAGSGSGTAVPEPAGFALMGLGLVFGLLRFRGRRPSST